MQENRLDEQFGVAVVAFESLALEQLAREHFGVAAELDVGPATGHVRADGDGAVAAGLRHDVGLAAVVLRVQHFVLDAAAPQHLREALGGLDRHRADQDRLAGGVHLGDLLDDVLVLPVDRAEHDVVVVLANDRFVGGDHQYVGAVDLLELLLLGLGGPGHAGDLVVELEEVLVRHRREGLVLALDLHAFLGFDRLVEPLPEAASRHQAPRELVDDHDLPVVVLHVLLVERVVLAGPQRLPQHVPELHVLVVEDVLDAEVLLGLGDALLGEVDVLGLLVGGVVAGGRFVALAGLALFETSAGPEMISGVRASSMRMLSTSSMMA